MSTHQQIRDCNTCKFHTQGRWGGSPICNLCVVSKEDLPYWEPRVDEYVAAINDRHMEQKDLASGQGYAAFQSRKESLAEASLNTLSGFVLSYLVWVLVASPLFNIPVNYSESFWITCLFTVVSVVRSYVWRRLFNKRSKPRKVGYGAI